MSSLCIIIVDGILSITLKKLVHETGKVAFAFGVEKALSSIITDGTEKRLSLILTKLDDLKSDVARVSSEVKGAIAEGDLKQLEAEIKSRLLACKEKQEHDSMTMDDARELLQSALHLQSVTTGTVGIGISGSYFETVRQHLISNENKTDVFQFWEIFKALVSYYGTMLMAAYSALQHFESFQIEAGSSLQEFLNQAFMLLGCVPKVIKQLCCPLDEKEPICFVNKSTGAYLRVSGNCRWYLHQIADSKWFRFENESNSSGIDHFFGKQVLKGASGSLKRHHLWTFIVTKFDDSHCYFTIQNKGSSKLLHDRGKRILGRPILFTAPLQNSDEKTLWYMRK